MINSGMMICSFFLKKKYSKGTTEVYKLNSKYEYEIDEETKISYPNIQEMFKNFCSINYHHSKDEKKSKTFRVQAGSLKEYDDTTYYAMTFTVVCGGYGIESDLTDSDTDEILFHRSPNVADNKSFNVLIFVPKDTEETIVSKGILIFQTIGTYGVKTITVNKMRSFFDDIGLTISTRSVSIKALFENLIESNRLHKITLVKNKISPCDADNMLISTGREEKTYIKPHLKQQWLGKMIRLFESKAKPDVYEIDGEEFEDIKVQFSFGGHMRTASLTRIDRFSMIEDFPQDIYNNANFDIEKLLNYMLDTAISYKEKMVFTINDEG